jgi:tetratricopeptide (TPR) repeat protein
MAYARGLMKIGDRELAAQILQQYLVDHGDDYQAQLVLLDAQNTASSPVLYQAALWKLYNRHPDSRMLCEHLFLYLLEFNDLSGAESVLRHYQAATGRSREPWLLEYRAVLAAVRKDYAAAVRLLEDRLALEDSWEGRFNLAVLLGRAGRAEDAIQQLIEAEDLLPGEGNLSFRSRIRSGIGEQYLQLGDEAAARRECEYAIDLDISNFHAHRILRILERE